MTVTGPATTGEVPADQRAPMPSAPSDSRASCTRCGAALADDQEWCLECGAARTVILGAPHWWVPLAIIGVLTLLVLAGVAIALLSLA
jgi:uncharacterized paraquat-inducible protein A